MAMGQGGGRFLVAWQALGDHSIWESALIRLNRSFELRNFTRMLDGGVQFDLAAPKNWSYGVEVTTNFVNWSPVIRGMGYGNTHPEGRVTVPATLAGTGHGSFFRAF